VDEELWRRRRKDERQLSAETFRDPNHSRRGSAR
jgi:hypothetical protein